MLPLHFKFQPSSQLAIMQSLICIASCTILLYYAPILWAGLAVLLISALTLYAVLNHAWLRLPWSLVAMHIDRQHRVRLQRRDGRWVNMRVLPSSTAWSVLIVLRTLPCISHGWHKLLPRNSILLLDSLPSDDRRKLMVWLRWGVNQSHAW